MRSKKMQPTTWVSCVDGQWTTKSGINVTKFLWSQDKKIWFWLVSMPEEILLDLMPSLTKDGLGKRSWVSTIQQTNKYRAKAINKLGEYAKKGDFRRYNTLIKILSRNSKSFRIWMYDATTEGAIMKKSTRSILESHLKYQLKVRGKLPKFNCKRVWIPKADGTLRPLSVPRLEDRWLAKIMMIWFEIWLEGMGMEFHENMFGCINNRSTAKAWNKVIKDLVPKKYVFEFDIAKCYDTIRWDAVWSMVRGLKLPPAIANYILTTLKTFQKIEGSDVQRAEQLRLRLNKTLGQNDLAKVGKGWIERKWLDAKSNKIRLEQEGEIEKVVRWSQMKEKLSTDLWKFRGTERYLRLATKYPNYCPVLAKMRNAEHMKLDQYGIPDNPSNLFDNKLERLEVDDCGIGIPQGWALSPMICNIMMQTAFYGTDMKAEWVTYLDDGLIAADSLEEMKLAELGKQLQSMGLVINESKSALNKEDGKWLKDIKFLGALLKKDGKFLAATRKGATQELLTPPTRVLSGEAMYSANWEQQGLNFIKEVKLDEAQLAWIYNNGGVYDNNGNWTPVRIGKVWQNSWKKPRWEEWKSRNPEIAARINNWLQQEETRL